MTDMESLLEQLDTLTFDQRLALLRRYEEKTLPYCNIIAADVSLEDYMERYAAEHCEWVEGYVIQMSPAELAHNGLIYFLYQLFSAYFELKALGRVVGQPFVMRLAAFPKRRREPDLIVILKDNPHELKDTYMDGAADICIEVVSEGSVDRDHGEKFKEYEKGGVPEYWILDPLHRESRFLRLNTEGRYIRFSEDVDGNYTPPKLPALRLHVPTLWQEVLPGPAATAQAVKTMLEQNT